MKLIPPRGRTALGLALLCLLAVPVVAQDAADPFEQAREAFMAAEGFDARMAILKEFLSEHPNHAEAPDVLQAGADLYIEDRDDRPAAVALAEHQLTVTTDAEIVGAVRGVLLGLYAHPVYAFKLETLVTEHYDPATMTYGQHLNVLEAAAAAESWSLVDAQFKAAMPKANAETFAADYPDRDFSAEEIEVAGRNREGLIVTFAGWSQANQGDAGKAIKMYKQADEMLRKSYLGVPTNDLYRFWGQTLLMQGKSEEGFEKLTLAALYGGDDEADAIARKGYAEFRPGESFDDFAWTVRTKHAPEMTDFSAGNYQGTVQSFHELKGEKATLVAFWFPT